MKRGSFSINVIFAVLCLVWLIFHELEMFHVKHAEDVFTGASWILLFVIVRESVETMVMAKSSGKVLGLEYENSIVSRETMLRKNRDTLTLIRVRFVIATVRERSNCP